MRKRPRSSICAWFIRQGREWSIKGQENLYIIIAQNESGFQLQVQEQLFLLGQIGRTLRWDGKRVKQHMCAQGIVPVGFYRHRKHASSFSPCDLITTRQQRVGNDKPGGASTIGDWLTLMPRLVGMKPDRRPR